MIMYINRTIEKTIKMMANEFPVIVISGARQVGKSTMLQMIKEENMNYVTLDDLDARNLALVLGNEGRGIRELVKKNCDELVKIPMENSVESLNVSVASAIAIYELWG